MSRTNEHVSPLPAHFIDRAAHYRNLAKRQADPAKAAEYRNMAELMDRQAADASAEGRAGQQRTSS